MTGAARASIGAPVEARSVESRCPPIVMDGRTVTPIAREYRLRVSAGSFGLGWERWRPARVVVEGADVPSQQVEIRDWEARAVLGIWIVAAALAARRSTRRST